MNAVWIIDDDRSIRWVLEKALTREGIACRSFGSADEALAALDVGEAPRALVSDIRMPGTSGLDLLKLVKTNFPELPVIIMTAYSDLDSAVAAVQGGAFEYLPKHSMSIRRWRWCVAPSSKPRRARPVARCCRWHRKSLAMPPPCRRSFAPSVACRSRMRRS
jgi:DNA-binding NtrC family response regulator